MENNKIFNIMLKISILLSLVSLGISLLYTNLVTSFCIGFITFCVSYLFLGFTGLCADLETEDEMFWKEYNRKYKNGK